MNFQLGQVERLEQVVVGAFLHGRHGRLDAAVGRQQKRLQVGLPLLELLQQLDAVDPRQVQVEDGHVEARLGGDLQGLLAAAGVGDGQALALEAADQRAAHLLVVVHEQQADRRP